MFTQPKQGSDGRYYTRFAEPKFVQVNGVKVLSSFVDNDSVTLGFSDTDPVTGVDQMLIDAAKENCEVWFGKKVAEKTLEAGYTGSLSNDTMIVDKATKKGECIVRAFNSNRTILDLADVQEGTVCDVVLEIAGLTFFKKNYSPAWKIVQLKIKPQPKQKRQRYTDECMFEPEADEPELDQESDEDDF